MQLESAHSSNSSAARPSSYRSPCAEQAPQQCGGGEVSEMRGMAGEATAFGVGDAVRDAAHVQRSIALGLAPHATAFDRNPAPAPRASQQPARGALHEGAAENSTYGSFAESTNGRRSRRTSWYHETLVRYSSARQSDISKSPPAPSVASSNGATRRISCRTTMFWQTRIGRNQATRFSSVRASTAASIQPTTSRSSSTGFCSRRMGPTSWTRRLERLIKASRMTPNY